MSARTLTRRKLLEYCAATPLISSFPPALHAQAQSEALELLVEDANRLPQLHALLILRGGEPLFGRAFRGPPLDRPVNVKSVSKTIVALLTGIAIKEGHLSGPEATLGELAPELIPSAADPRASDISVGNLLTMTAGLERTSGPNYGAWVQSSNWVSHALSRPLVAEPGSRFQYSTGCFHIVGAVLTRITGRSLLELARNWLGAPLMIDIPPWTRDPQGFYMGGNNMALSPSALARIGEMVRAGGVWTDREVVPASWIADSWRPRTRSPYSGDEYGYGWFLTQLGGEAFAYARGYGGQMLYVARGLDLTVAITSDPTRPARTAGHVGDLNRLLARRIIPLV